MSQFWQSTYFVCAAASFPFFHYLIQSGSGAQQDEKYVLNKVAHIFALVLVADYPSQVILITPIIYYCSLLLLSSLSSSSSSSSSSPLPPPPPLSTIHLAAHVGEAKLFVCVLFSFVMQLEQLWSTFPCLPDVLVTGHLFYFFRKGKSSASDVPFLKCTVFSGV